MPSKSRPTARTAAAASAAAAVAEESAVADYPRALYKGDPHEQYDAKRANDAAEASKLKRKGYKEAEDFFPAPAAEEPVAE